MGKIEQSQVSVVIPTYNEAVFVPQILSDIENYLPGVQVVVADARSDDATLDVIKSFRSRLSDLKSVKTESRKPGPGATRNAGAAVADGSFLAFFDADERLRNGFFESAFNEVDKRQLDAAGCQITPDSEVLTDKVIWRISNFYAVSVQKILPTAMGGGIIAKKDLYKKIGGFREDLQVCEDLDFAKRAARAGNFGMLEKEGTDVITSVRRFEKKGRMKSQIQYLSHAFYYMLTNKPAPKIFGYDFGDF